MQQVLKNNQSAQFLIIFESTKQGVQIKCAKNQIKMRDFSYVSAESRYEYVLVNVTFCGNVKKIKFFEKKCILPLASKKNLSYRPRQNVRVWRNW